MYRTRRKWSHGYDRFFRATEMLGNLRCQVFRRGGLSRIAILGVASLACVQTVAAHEPNRECGPVTPRVDLIGPIGNNLPIGHRRKYNRPSYLEGKIAYKIAPSSQEAMAWHHAEHTGAYSDEKKCQRYERHYWYPKPWQVLRVGQRPSVLEAPQDLKPISNGLDDLSNVPESLELPSEDALDLQEPLSLELESNPKSDPLMASQVDHAAEFAPIAIASTPGIEIEANHSNLKQAGGNGEPEQVSRTSVSQTSGTLEKQSKVAWFKQLLQRGLH